MKTAIVTILIALGLAPLGCEYHNYGKLDEVKEAPVPSEIPSQTEPAASPDLSEGYKILHKQIEDLNKKLDEVKKTPAPTPPPSAEKPVIPPSSLPAGKAEPEKIIFGFPTVKEKSGERVAEKPLPILRPEEKPVEKPLPVLRPQETSLRLVGYQFKGGLGGDGGAPYTFQCPDQEAVSGFEIRAGAVIDSIDIECKPIDPDYYINGKHQKPLPRLSGGAGGPGGGLSVIEAPQGAFITGFNAKAHTVGVDIEYEKVDHGFSPKYKPKTKQIDVLSEFNPIASYVDAPNAPELVSGENGLMNDDPAGEGDGDVDWTRVACDPGYIMTGIVGKAGLYVDSINLIECRKVVKD